MIHLTAVYSSPTIPTLAICKMLKKPLVWSPRGALQRFNTSTRTKAKTLWERVCNSLCDEDRVILHVTSDEEKQESCARIPRAGTAVIPNGVEIPGTNGNRVALAGQELRLLYLGRLHPKKGIENLLRALSKLNLNPLLSICGDGDVGYRRSLEALVAELGLGKTVKFRGLVDGEVKEQQFQEADVCVVPSYSENFCLVVAEALARGVPVIASRSTPWAQVEDIGCGMWVDNDSKSLADAIVRMSAMPRQEMGRKGKDWMARSFAWSAIGQEMLSAYERLCR